jgi:hypothetical protein
MTDTLLAMIEGAKAAARPAFACEDSDHHWHSEGGRSCPMGAEGCSQAVYRCGVCGIHDYGSGPDSPGKIDCQAVCGDSMTGWQNGPLDPNPSWP